MSAFLGFVSMVAMLVFLILTIIMFIKKKPFKKHLIVLAAGFVLFLVAIAITPESVKQVRPETPMPEDVQKTETPIADINAEAKEPAAPALAPEEVQKPEPIQQVVPEPQPQVDTKATIEEAARKRVKERLKEVKVNDYAYDLSKKFILVYFSGSDHLTTSLIRDTMKIDASYVFENIYGTGLPIQEVTCFIGFPMKDKYGNETEINVMKISLTGETAGKVNWSGVDRANFDKVANSFWMHPALKK
ncbi:MAG: hypothetical protein M1489_01895 [Firmicutes bacterium]|nr:hypothetical protein [Bacillota bacterium]